MEISFKGKRALVTGGSRGIGKEVVRKLLQCGAEVVAISKTQSKLDELKAELPTVTTVCLDIGDHDQTRKTVQNLGHFDLLVNNAGISSHFPIEKATMKELDRVLDVNFKSVFNISQIVANAMVEKGRGGAIVNVSSIGALFAFKGGMVYGTSKAALDYFSKSMALEYGPHGIRTNIVHPTAIDTDMLQEFKELVTSETQKIIHQRMIDSIPMGRIGTVDDVAGPVIFLLSDLAKFVNGVSLAVDGGQIIHF